MKSRWPLALAASACCVLASSPSRARAEPDCPPEEWFCDEPGEPERLPEAAPADPDSDASPEEWVAPPPEGPRGDAELDVRRPAASVSEQAWSEGSGGRGASPWGLAIRVQGVMLDGKRREPDARLGGLGVSGRYEVNPVVTLDLGLDSIIGRDYNGYDRSELTLSFSSLFFLNDNPVVRTYLLAGLNTSRARVDVMGEDQTWGYLGLQGGLGLDVTLGPRVAVNVDLVAFLRGRTDSRAAREPEFTDGLGRVSNTSGGGLLRGGVTLHFRLPRP